MPCTSAFWGGLPGLLTASEAPAVSAVKSPENSQRAIPDTIAIDTHELLVTAPLLRLTSFSLTVLSLHTPFYAAPLPLDFSTHLIVSFLTSETIHEHMVQFASAARFSSSKGFSRGSLVWPLQAFAPFDIRLLKEDLAKNGPSRAVIWRAL
jgi:hypothetical protein